MDSLHPAYYIVCHPAGLVFINRLTASICVTTLVEMPDQTKLQDLINRLERMRGPYLGDGINPGITTYEVLEFLKPLQEVTIQSQLDQSTK